MREHPILFSAPMVRAILDGRKTQTRRILTVPWRGSVRATPYEPYYAEEDGRLLVMDDHGEYHSVETHMRHPYGYPGDLLWVKETHQHFGNASVGSGPWFEQVKYAADGEVRGCGEWSSHEGMPRREWWNTGRAPWTPSIFMPRRYSRITLRVTEVRAQRLQAITEADSIAEGLAVWSDPPRMPGPHYGLTRADVWETDPRKTFWRLWDSINAKRAPWASNPWIWAITFERCGDRDGER